jgi:hypothetical protein
MDIRSAARALGGDVANRSTVLCPGPGHKPGDRSLSVTFDATAPDGFLVQSFANNDWQDCKDHVRQLLGLGSFEPGQQPERNTKPFRFFQKPDPTPEAVRRTEFALSLWKEAASIGWTPAEAYLIGRGIIVPPMVYSGHALRFHKACPFKLESGVTVRLPAMLGAMVDIETGEFRGIHRTAIKEDGSGKAEVAGLGDPKKMLGPSGNACVRLYPSVSDRIAIAEGIETSLSVAGNFGVSPIWACLSAGTMARFPVLADVQELFVFADNDEPKTMPNGRLRQAGNEAASECAMRWAQAGRLAAVWLPPQIGTDFNDVSKGAA